jgi:hypothetical protein
MADRFWVGGTGNWTDASKWAATSGGPGGAGVPASNDNAYFDGNSDVGSNFTVTVDAGASCRDLIIGDGGTVSVLDVTMTLAGSAALNISGSLFFPTTNLTNTFTGTITFNSNISNTITTNGISLNGNVTLFGTGGWTLQSSLTFALSTTLDIAQGTFNTGGYNVSCGNFNSNNSNIRSIILNNSTITTRLSSTSWNISNSTNLTFDAGTSTIDAGQGASSGTFAGGGLTYHVVNLRWLTSTVTGSNTFVDLTKTFSSSVSIIENFIVIGNQAISGVLTLLGASVTRRLFVLSNTVGTPRTLTVNNLDANNVDFRDITVNDNAAWDDSDRSKSWGDCGGNTGITFSSPITSYRRGTGNWSDNQWALESGGTPTSSAFPLPQDTIIFDGNTTSGTHTINANYNIGTLDLQNTPVGVSMGFGGSTNEALLYGDVILNENIVLSGSGTTTFSGRGTQNVTSAGKTFSRITRVNSVGTVRFVDNFRMSGLQALALLSGILDVNNTTVTVPRFQSNTTNFRTLRMGSGKFVLTVPASEGGRVWDCANISNMTIEYTTELLAEIVGGGVSGEVLSIAHGSTGGTEQKALSYKVTTGSFLLTFGSPSIDHFNNVDYTGFSGSVDSRPGRIYGNYIMSPTATYTAGTLSAAFLSSKTQNIITNEQILDFPIIKTGRGTLQLQDNLTQPSTRTFTLTQGTINLNGKKLTTGTFSTSNTNERIIDFNNNGTLEITQSGSAFAATTATNLVTTGTGQIVMSSDSSKTFIGGGSNYPTLVQGGTGTLTITGNNTFDGITNTVVGNVTVTSGSTQNVRTFSLRGTPVNKLVLAASSTTNYTLNKLGGGIVSCDHLDVSRATATPAENTWYAGESSINNTDNTGIEFKSSPSLLQLF